MDFYTCVDKCGCICVIFVCCVAVRLCVCMLVCVVCALVHLLREVTVLGVYNLPL